MLKILVPPQESFRFSPENAPVVLDSEDIEKFHAGLIDVAIYGRIFYRDLAHNPFYQVSFCYYVLANGATSACTDKEHAYTNFAH